MITTPQHYGLSSRITLEELAPNHMAIVKRIKSRIIRKDAEKIITMAQQIKDVAPSTKVSLLCNDNICSKSIKLLDENGVDVMH